MRHEISAGFRVVILFAGEVKAAFTVIVVTFVAKQEQYGFPNNIAGVLFQYLLAMRFAESVVTDVQHFAVVAVNTYHAAEDIFIQVEKHIMV